MSNALNEAKHQLMIKSRNVTTVTAKEKNSALLSSKMLEYLDNKILPDTDSANSIGMEETQADSNSTVHEPTGPLNDSITQLKQTIQTEKPTPNNSKSNILKGQNVVTHVNSEN